MKDEIRDEEVTPEVAEETTGTAPVVEEEEVGADAPTESGDEDGDDAPDEEEGPGVTEVEVAKYRITGLVDIFDEQRNITGQFPIGSVQELPVEYGTVAVAEGRAEAVGTDETDKVE